MNNQWPEFNLTTREWHELVAIEYTLTMYPNYYAGADFNKAENRLTELRELRHQKQNKR